jgi:hypothetical protein
MERIKKINNKYHGRSFFLSRRYGNGCGPGTSVGIATELRAARSGDRIPVKGRFSAPVQTGPGANPASCTMGTVFIQGVKSGRGVTLTHQSLPVPLVMKELSYTSEPPMGRTACTVNLYISSPYGPYGLYRASVPVQ